MYFGVLAGCCYCHYYPLPPVFVQDEEDEDFLSISRAMEEIVDDPMDCYWLIKCFVNQFLAKFGDSVPHLVSVRVKENIVSVLHISFKWYR